MLPLPPVIRQACNQTPKELPLKYRDSPSSRTEDRELLTPGVLFAASR